MNASISCARGLHRQFACPLPIDSLPALCRLRQRCRPQPRLLLQDLLVEMPVHQVLLVRWTAPLVLSTSPCSSHLKANHPEGCSPVVRAGSNSAPQGVWRANGKESASLDRVEPLPLAPPPAPNLCKRQTNHAWI